MVLFAASDIIQCCFSVENQETLQRSLFLISSLNNWHSWVLFCFSSTYFSEMIWSTLIISTLISPQSQSPTYSWLLDSYSDGPQIPSLSRILKLNSSSAPNLFASIQSQWMCFLPQLKIPKFTRSLKQRKQDRLPLTLPLSFHPLNLPILPPEKWFFSFSLSLNSAHLDCYLLTGISAIACFFSVPSSTWI